MQAWIAAQAADELVISTWVVTEFSAALSIKVRTGYLNPIHRAAAATAFSRLAMESFRTLPVPERAFRTAARFADRSDLGLRAGDALHLAITADEGLVLATLDRRLAGAGAAVGAATRLI